MYTQAVGTCTSFVPVVGFHAGFLAGHKQPGSDYKLKE